MKYFPIIAAVVYFCLSGYVFLFAPCETAHDFWMLVYTPGRCITHGASGNW